MRVGPTGLLDERPWASRHVLGRHRRGAQKGRVKGGGLLGRVYRIMASLFARDGYTQTEKCFRTCCSMSPTRRGSPPEDMLNPSGIGEYTFQTSLHRLAASPPVRFASDGHRSRSHIAQARCTRLVRTALSAGCPCRGLCCVGCPPTFGLAFPHFSPGRLTVSGELIGSHFAEGAHNKRRSGVHLLLINPCPLSLPVPALLSAVALCYRHGPSRPPPHPP